VKRARRWARFLAWAAAGLGCVALAAVGYVAALWLTLPSVEALARADPRPTSFMRRRASEAGARVAASRSDWVAIDMASPLLVCAVLKAEDRGFFRHSGFEWSQLRKAADAWLRGEGRMGGSTITQQLARNLYLGPERTIGRKLREGVLTRRLERALGKQRILELYLNVIEWGDGIWGMDAAARAYFGKGARELDAFEASFLASLVAAPRRRLAGPYRERAELTQTRVLHQLLLSGVIDADAWTGAMAAMRAVHTALAGGSPLASALRRAEPVAVATVSRTIAADGGCGLDREVAATAAYRNRLRAASH
jgi:monofunctional glycosyltransferase